jgi:hypothetical protein
MRQLRTANIRFVISQIVVLDRILKQPSRAKYQQQKHGKEQQVNATLQDTRLAAAKTDHAHGQGEQEQWKIAAFDAERY